MAQQKQQYEDVMSSIFDFLFEQSRKSPDKARPVKPSRPSKSRQGQAIEAALSMPLTFVSEPMIDALKEAAELEATSFNIKGKVSDSFKIKVKDFLKDPSAYVDKQFATMEAIRKMNRISTFGEEMSGVLAGVWARGEGLDPETATALSQAVKTAGSIRVPSDKFVMSAKNRQLIDKYIPPGDDSASGIDESSLNSRFGDATTPEGKKYSEIYLGVYKKEKETIREIEKELREAIQDGDPSKVSRARRDLEMAKNKLSQKENIYVLFEGQEFQEKAENSTNNEERRAYKKVGRFLDNVVLNNEVKRFIASTEKLKKDYIREIDRLRGEGASASEINEYKEEIKKLDSELSNVRGIAFGKNLGKLEGYYYTLKSYSVDGKLIPSIFSGDFFDYKKNKIEWLQPSILGNVVIKKNRKGEDILAKEVHFAKITGNPIKQQYYDTMNSVYYLTPGTMVRSLFNGESFAYFMQRGRNKFQANIVKALEGKLRNINPNVMEGYLKNMDGIMSILGKDIVDLDNNEIFRNLPKEFQVILKDSELSKLFKEFVKKDSNLQSLTLFFSSAQRLKNSIQDAINKKFLQGIRDRVGDFLLRNVVDTTVMNTINTWVTHGGLQNLVRAVVTKIATSLGIATTGFGGLVIGAVTWVATDVVYRIIKPVIKFAGETGKLGIEVVAYTVLVGLVVAVLFLGSIYMAVFGQYSHIAPGECIECEAFGGYADDYRYGPDPYDYECYECDGELFASISGMPSYEGVLSEAKQYFDLYIAPNITAELMEVYSKTEEATGVPCEIVAAIHFIEASNNPNKSLWDGGELRGTLLEDAISAMQHLLSKSPTGSLGDFETLVTSLSRYSGGGIGNCTSYPKSEYLRYSEQFRPTRWRENLGRCVSDTEFEGEDDAYAMNWLTPRHSNMDLTNCRPLIDFECDREANTNQNDPNSDYNRIIGRYNEVYNRDATQEELDIAFRMCFRGSNLCDSEENRFPSFKRPGVLTVALMIHNSSMSFCQERPSRPGGGTDIDIQCQSGESLQDFFKRIAAHEKFGITTASLELISKGHPNYTPGSTWWCFARNENLVQCKIDKVNTCSEYIGRLFQHEIVHLVQYRNNSRDDYGGLFMEWGAEWHSGDAGGYRFTTKNGDCILATNTPMLDGCTEDIYYGIAFNEAQYANHPCFGRLKSYITGFCR